MGDDTGFRMRVSFAILMCGSHLLALARRPVRRLGNLFMPLMLIRLRAWYRHARESDFRR